MTGRSVTEANQLNQLAEASGARTKTVYNEAKTRENIEERKQIVPYLKLVARKRPEGIEVVYFFENPLVSDVLKGYTNVINEVVKSDSVENFVFQRQKECSK